MEFFLRSSRLGIRTWTKDDLPLALELWRDPAVTSWLVGPLTAEAVQARLAREIQLQNDFRVQYWPAFLLATGEFAGCAGLRPKAEGLLELGYYFMPAFWGLGLATEAGQAIIAHAFSTLGVETLFAGHHPANAASRQVLTKLGFQPAGEEFYEPSGVIEPTYLLHKSDARANQNQHQS